VTLETTGMREVPASEVVCRTVRWELGTTRPVPQLTTGAMLIDVPAGRAKKAHMGQPGAPGREVPLGQSMRPGCAADGRSRTGLTDPGGRRFERSEPIASQQPDA
jgi:hypothetical protein